MKSYIDQKLVKKNATIGKYLRWTSLGFMVLGLFAIFSDSINQNPTIMFLFFMLMLLGVVLSSISGYFTNKFSTSPRPDEMIDKAFKGLNQEHLIFHYKSGIHHFMVSPSGLWAIIPLFMNGSVYYDENKKNWYHKRKSFLNSFFQKESFPDPKKEYQHQQNELDKLSSKLSKPIDHRLKMVMIFFNKDMSLPEFTEGENILLIYADKAKDRFRKYPKAEHSFSYQELIEYLGKK